MGFLASFFWRSRGRRSAGPSVGRDHSGVARRARSRRRPLIEPLEGRKLLTPYTVNTFQDFAQGDPNQPANTLSLREAIQQANNHPGDDTVVLPPGPCKLTLGELDISGNNKLTIQGTTLNIDPSTWAIDGQGKDRVFHITGGQVEFDGLVITDGAMNPLNFNGNHPNAGTGILNEGGTVTLNNCIVSNNHAYTSVFPYLTFGGGIASYGGSVTANTSQFLDNSSDGGGGVFSDQSSSFTATNTHFVGNYVLYGGDQGGGILAASTLTLTSCQFSDNQGCYGGAIRLAGANCKDSITSSSFDKNQASMDGGAIDICGASSASPLNVTIGNSNFTGNGAQRYGGAIACSTDSYVTLSGDYFYDNGAVVDGGAVWNTGAILIANATIDGGQNSPNLFNLSAFGNPWLYTKPIYLAPH
jgi:predicted outer membrane repeat protein